MFATGCESSGVQTLVACEGRDRLHASCPAGQVINVIDGFYGRAVPDTELCPFGRRQNDDTTCRSRSSSTLVNKLSFLMIVLLMFFYYREIAVMKTHKITVISSTF